jgi:hypothetical protein
MPPTFAQAAAAQRGHTQGCVGHRKIGIELDGALQVQNGCFIILLLMCPLPQA